MCPANLVLHMDNSRCLRCCNASDPTNAHECCDCRDTKGEGRGRVLQNQRKGMSPGFSQEHEGERDGTFQRINRTTVFSIDFLNIFFN